MKMLTYPSPHILWQYLKQKEKENKKFIIMCIGNE